MKEGAVEVTLENLSAMTYENAMLHMTEGEWIAARSALLDAAHLEVTVPRLVYCISWIALAEYGWEMWGAGRESAIFDADLREEGER